MSDQEYYEASVKEAAAPKEAKKKRLPVAVAIILFVLAALVVGVGSCAVYQLIRSKDRDTRSVMSAPVQDELNTSNFDPVGTQSSEATAPSKLKVSTSDVSDLVDSVMPAIVKVCCTLTYSYDSFWGIPMEYEGTSSGTGFLVSQSINRLYIATNNHVIGGATSIEVTFCDDTTASAEVIGVDTSKDIAVIAVNFNDIEDSTLNTIRIASLGDSTQISVGEMVVAIGNSLGYGQSSTVGYVSAIDRQVTVENVTNSLIQTDAAINPGNSGGPLLNAHGQVIGINSVKFANEDVERMGYAIPISFAIPIINDLIGYENLTESEMGYLGIQGQDVSQSYSTGFNMPMGVYVYSIEEGSAAAASDLKVGDIITKVGDREVTSMGELQNRLSHTRAGSEITLTVARLDGTGYSDHVIYVTLGSRP